MVFKYPSKVIYFITFVLFVGYQFIDFKVNGENRFEQLRYNWSHLKTVKNLGLFTITEITFDEIKFQEDSIFPKINFNNTLAIEAKNEIHYFKAQNIFKIKNGFKIVGGWWLNGMPKLDENKTVASLQEVDLPIIQGGNRKVLMLGGEQAFLNEGKRLRKFIYEQDKEVVFVGSKNDVFGYPHDCEINMSYQTILENWNNLPTSQVIVVWVEPKQQDTLLFENTISEFSKKALLSKSEFIIITSTRDSLQAKLISKLRESKLNKFTLMVLDENGFETEEYFNESKNCLTINGYKKLARKISQSLAQ